MIFVFLLLLLAPASRVELVDEVFDVPPAEWRYVELSLKQEPVAVVCHFEAAGGRTVRLALLRREDLDRMREDRPHGVVALAPMGTRGYLRHVVREPGDYCVVLDNRDDTTHAAQVRLRVSLDFAAAPEPHARTLSPTRRAVVVALSCLAFFGIVLVAGRRLLRNMRR